MRNGTARATTTARALAGALAVAATAAAVPELAAQSVLGTAVDARDGRPIGGAFVLLVDEEGVERDRGLTTARGTFRLSSGREGTYRLRLERIGFEDLETELFRLPADEVVSRRLDVAPRPVRLSEIEVSGVEPRCGTPAGEAMELSRVWDEARKALEATAWTDRQSYYRFDVLLVRQALDEDANPVAAAEYEPIRIYGRHPFRTIQPDDLAYGGWVQRQGARGLKFFAPDADVLLSESFLSRHCFRLVRSDSAGRHLVGIGFEPTPNRGVPDIAGVLWIDRASAELRSLRFSYENLRLPVDTDRLGGSVEFDHLPDGGWIVRQWEILTPQAELVRQSRGSRRRERVRLSGLQREGQRVLAVWRTGDLQASPSDELPSGVQPVHAPPDEILRRYPPPPELAERMRE